MGSKIHVVKGKGSKDYVLDTVEGKNTIVLLTELEYTRKYRGDKRNIQVGKSYSSLDVELFKGYECVVVEPYDTNDFKAFMGGTKLLKDFLKGTGQDMYIVLGKKVKIEGHKDLQKSSRKMKGLDIDTFKLK